MKNYAFKFESDFKIPFVKMNEISEDMLSLNKHQLRNIYQTYFVNRIANYKRIFAILCVNIIHLK